MGESHSEQVTFEDRIGRTFYGIACPICGADYRHEIKPRGRDPGFVEEFSAHIRLVAFDMLVNHLLVEHDPETAPLVQPGEGEPAPAAPPSAPASGPAWLMEARRRAGGGSPEASG
ncbi:MAG TPA: hypothetical protein VI854_05660 [Acidimicrobiia bacterium]|nr:hypothetical protein [Acidimicrobiia bacterium]